jgi:HPt (histidine-containing phosphotransfer) domain-containing protein
METLARRGALIAALIVSTISIFALTGCGASVDPALVKTAGRHGDVMQVNYKLLTKKVLEDASTRDLKDINAAIKAGDLKKATPGDLRRAEGEIQHRIDSVVDYRRDLVRANATLRRTAVPEFGDYLDDDGTVMIFTDAYDNSTRIIKRGGTAAVASTKVALSFLERYLDFLEQWEEYLADNDTTGLESSAKASDKALATLNRRQRGLERATNVTPELKREVDRMAKAASSNKQLAELITQLKKDYPNSFLAKNIKEAD